MIIKNACCKHLFILQAFSIRLQRWIAYLDIFRRKLAHNHFSRINLITNKVCFYCRRLFLFSKTTFGLTLTCCSLDIGQFHYF